MFKNREEAGRKLAEKLSAYKNDMKTVILALPRGGVVIGFEAAKILNLPLDIIVPRKLGAPGNPEYAIGAITESGQPIFNENALISIDQEWLVKEIKKEKIEAWRRLKTYRGNRSPLDLTGQTAIIVDDGIATGLTMRAAIASLKKQNPKKIIVAVPVSAADSYAAIKKEVREIISLQIPEFFNAVGSFYEEFPQIEDRTVVKLLKKSKQ